MKSKNPQAFWLRWMGVSSLHAVLFTAFWLLNPALFAQWFSFIPVTLGAGIILTALQYWAMPQTMRPSSKRWFSAGITGQVIASVLHGFVLASGNATSPWPALLALFLPIAISQSWALSERFKKAWFFGLAMILPILLYLGRGSIDVYLPSQAFVMDVLFWLIRAGLSGLSLSYLQKHELKETSALNQSYERLELPEEEALVADEGVVLAQQKLS